MFTSFVALFALALGWLLARRVLRERDPLLAGALAPLLACTAVLVAANCGLRGPSLLAAVVIPAFLLAFTRRTGYRVHGSSRGQKVFLLTGLLVVLLYAHYAQMRFLDSDNWIHEPLVSAYSLGVWPPHNPFFPDLPLNGHYGRDLLVSVFTSPGQDPLATVWFLNPLLQGATFLALVASIRSLTGMFWPGYLAAMLMFFGVNVGFRVGLVDTFDSNNGVVYALLVLNLHLLFRLFRPAPVGRDGQRPVTWKDLLPTWLLAGVVLGTFQIVYETHFGLLVLTGLTLGLVFRERRAWAGLLVVAAVALPLAATEGGPLTDLAQRLGRTEAVKAVQNQGQHVSIRFPKERLFTVLATDSVYQRVSAAYRTSLSSGLFRPPQGSGPVSIFDPRFLTTHWLPLYLAPFTLWVLWRRRSLPGLGLWFFGAWAYLVPGLVDFGVVYEWEYFRWEFAAGVGWAGALGLALSFFLPPQGGWPVRVVRDQEGWNLCLQRGTLPVALAGLVLLADLAAAQKMLNDAVIDLQKVRVPLFISAGRWRTLQPELRTFQADLEAAEWLAERVRPGQRFLSNRTDGTPPGIWADAVFATRSGALPAGHAFPPGSDGTHGAPPFHADALSLAFWATGHSELPSLAGVDWLLVDPDRLAPGLFHRLQVDSGLEPGPLFLDDTGQRRQVFAVKSRPAVRTTGSLALEAVLPQQGELRVGQHHAVQIRVRNVGDRSARLGQVQARILGEGGAPAQETPLVRDFDMELKPGQEGQAEHSMVTPLDEGRFLYELSSGSAFLRVPFQVDFLARVGALRPRLDPPDGFKPRRFHSMRLGLTSDTPLSTRQELELFYRLRRPGGEYVWELDSIPQPLALDLQPGVEQEVFFTLLTPAEGAYELELIVKELRTGRTVRLGTPLRVTVGGS